MGYFMRFIQTDDRPTTLSVLGGALGQLDSAYSLEEGELRYGDDVYGVVEVNRPGDGLFDDEIGELIEAVEEARGWTKRRVLQTLKSAKAIIAVQILTQDRDTDATLTRIDPLWEWLFSNRQGLLQADGEGYYVRSKRLLVVE